MKLIDLPLMDHPSRNVGVDWKTISSIEPYDSGYSVGAKVILQNGTEFKVSRSASSLINHVNTLYSEENKNVTHCTGPL